MKIVQVNENKKITKCRLLLGRFKSSLHFNVHACLQRAAADTRFPFRREEKSRTRTENLTTRTWRIAAIPTPKPPPTPRETLTPTLSHGRGSKRLLRHGLPHNA
ncbi:hypothetical protein HMPREF9098_1640 [Kingella denitrificans ATCC 33394]|uniref:Uncharacterized protein n=1 Tax=Kingella denitrificans ATCC 33394 TaxID=888741 RepID=F0F0K5_9NEIS|nr:hypothetical protein HMPREF9098_1640 [Kingella denitrificans ATCC 33394]